MYVPFQIYFSDISKKGKTNQCYRYFPYCRHFDIYDVIVIVLLVLILLSMDRGDQKLYICREYNTQGPFLKKI